jgi:hypothetical protein
MTRTRRPLYMETTTTPAIVTAQQITALLIEAGARDIQKDHRADGTAEAIRFTLYVEGNPVKFRLPLRIDSIYQIIHGRRRINLENTEGPDRVQAEKIAWRHLFRWIEAQMAMIETGLAKSEELFLPYWEGAGGKTLYELIQGSEYSAIGPGKNTQ